MANITTAWFLDDSQLFEMGQSYLLMHFVWLCENHDWSYTFSDDSRCYSRGRNQRNYMTKVSLLIDNSQLVKVVHNNYIERFHGVDMYQPRSREEREAAFIAYYEKGVEPVAGLSWIP